MGKPDNKGIKEYLARIGKRGGQKSRRALDPETARNMVRVREARRAFKTYYLQCFWSFDPDLKITLNDVAWVSEQLMKNGSRTCWEIGRRLRPS
jgi:hypothetical protein